MTILPPARHHVERYLMAREEYLRENQRAEIKMLLPNIESTKGEYSDKALRYWKKKVEKESGVTFKLKDLRPTYAQMNKDRGVNIEAIAKFMGHASTGTTEKYYARLKDKDAFRSIEKVWGEDKPEIPKDVGNGPFIERSDNNAGYA